MAVSVFGNKLRYKGELEYQAFYNLLKGFFTSRGYDFYETRYKDKGNEYEVEWTCEREYDELHKIEFDIKYHAWDVQRLQVERSGKPKTLIKCRLQISFTAKLEKGYNDYLGQGVFGTSKFDALIQKIHGKLTQREVDEHWEVVMGGLLMGVTGQVKGFLGMQDS